MKTFAITYKDTTGIALLSTDRINSLPDQLKYIQGRTKESATKNFEKWFKENVYGYRLPTVISIEKAF